MLTKPKFTQNLWRDPSSSSTCNLHMKYVNFGKYTIYSCQTIYYKPNSPTRHGAVIRTALLCLPVCSVQRSVRPRWLSSVSSSPAVMKVVRTPVGSGHRNENAKKATTNFFWLILLIRPINPSHLEENYFWWEGAYNHNHWFPHKLILLMGKLQLFYGLSLKKNNH